MNSKEIKQLRGQVRSAVKEMLQDILTLELVDTLHKSLGKRVDHRLDAIAAHLKNTLDEVNNRSKDMETYVVRNLPQPAVPAETPLITPGTETPTGA